MHQTYIFLTETFLDQKKLEAVLIYNFFNNKNSFQASNIELFNLEMLESLELNIASGRVIIPEIDGKKDFTSQLLSFYQKYPKPSLLFLGNLNQYSLPMQEGMLRILEEPPENLYIVLTAENKTQILPTITSRSQLIKLNQTLILELLDPNLLKNVREKLPYIKDFYPGYINDKYQLEPDCKKLEREEIGFWLWQLEFTLKNIFLQKADLRIAKKIEKVLYAKMLNNQNLQKKFVLEGLKI